MHQLIEECCKEVLKEQKLNIGKTMLDLFTICHHKQFLCMHDDEKEVKIVKEQPAEHGNCSIQSLQNFRIVRKNSISFRDTSQISSIHSVAPILSTKELENSLSMGYEHLSITPETKSDEVIESNAENLLPIPSECEVALEDKRECDLLISENSPVCDNSDTFSDSKIDDDISVYDDDFEEIEYVEASLLDPEIVSVEEENVVQQEEEETRSGNTTHANYSLPEYDSFCFEIEPDQERLINLMKNDVPDNSSNDPLLEEANLFLFDDSIPPGIENVADDPEGDVRFLEELLIDDFILSHELSDDNFEDNPLISRPPPEPPNDNFDLEPEVSPLLLSAESEDTIFDPEKAAKKQKLDEEVEELKNIYKLFPMKKMMFTLRLLL
nr:hypothetical protein [Tanacetum cinerariifolium]